MAHDLLVVPARATSIEWEQFSDDAPAVDVVVTVQTEGRQAQGHGRLQRDQVHVHVFNHEGRKVVQSSVGNIRLNAVNELLLVSEYF